MDTILQDRSEKEGEGGAEPLLPDFWFETVDSVKQECRFDALGRLSVNVVHDFRPVYRRVVDSFFNKFFPSGYPYSVNEGYLTYTQFRALQHFSSATLSVLSTQSLLFAAGLRPTPAQTTAVSWVLKDGMQHAGKLICSKMGARMDSEPKSWRIFADVLYDFGTGLEIFSPLCPHLFLEVAGLGNFAKGMAVVAARATRLPIYSSFAKEGNLSDLFAKGEAISTLFNVLGIGLGIQLASTVCSSIQGKMIVGPVLSAVHLYGVTQEMRATPVNTLNPQRTAMIVADFLKIGSVSSPADLRYREDLLFPGRIIEDAGNVKVGRPLHRIFKGLRNSSRPGRCSPRRSSSSAAKGRRPEGWLVAACAASMEKSGGGPREAAMAKAHQRMEALFPLFISQVRARGWHTDRFLDGRGCRFSF
ncbi:unnamed protein product [Spirodela intermedia]|uniref:Protein root UVB sensitive/RUS domain-containing protein n=1 Tax=Spirodela intermedia TaxID=51605 RepID=A0A7I8ID13_SPIIN|nr:unnamed protein product [Spirodela intermedia]CAA6655275.1 unnamed protein product [Spirodela intermedia]